jgi:SNF2 family DNA or RNA helicase
MVDFVRPSHLGSWKEFSLKFEKHIQKGIHTDSNERDVKEAKKRMYIL